MVVDWIRNLLNRKICSIFINIAKKENVMKKIVSLIVAGAMLLSAFLMPSEQIKAETTTINGNDWYEMALPGGTSQEYVYEMPKSGYITIEVACQYYMHKNQVSDSTTWWMPVKVVVNDKLYENTNVYYSNGVWTSSMLSFKEGTKVRLIFSSSSVSDYQWYYKFRVVEHSVKNLETENNNSKSSADKVKLNTTYNGIMMLDDEDYYVFTAPSKGRYAVKAVNTDIDHYYGLTCALYNNSYKCLASTRLGSGEGWKKVGTVSLKKGQKVYMKYSSYDKNFCYKLKVKKVS